MDGNDGGNLTAIRGAGIDRREALAGAAALLAAALAGARPARAQDATPAAGGAATELAPGVSLVALPEIAPFALPAEPGAVLVVWLVLEPGAALRPHDHPFSEFAIVRSGTAMFRTEAGPAARLIRSGGGGASTEEAEPGVELAAGPGDVAVFPSGNRSDTRAGAEGAEILVLEIVTHWARIRRDDVAGDGSRTKDGVGTPGA